MIGHEEGGGGGIGHIGTLQLSFEWDEGGGRVVFYLPVCILKVVVTSHLHARKVAENQHPWHGYDRCMCQSSHHSLPPPHFPTRSICPQLHLFVQLLYIITLTLTYFTTENPTIPTKCDAEMNRAKTQRDAKEQRVVYKVHQLCSFIANYSIFSNFETSTKSRCERGMLERKPEWEVSI